MLSSTRIRLVALDLDGTLVGEDLVVSPRVRDAVKAARERGVAVTIVTGRMFAAARPFAQLLEIDGPIVCYQGAAVFDASSGATLRETPVQPDVTRAVLEWANAHGVHAQCYADDLLYVEAINRFSKRYTDLARVEPHVVPSLREAFAHRPTIKIVLVDEAARSDAHLAALRALLGDRAYLTRSHVDFVEVIDPRVNKGEALAFVAQRCGVALDATLAVGDAWNDVPLLDAAAVGVAMGSGPPELLARADHVVGDVANDGVAEAIERYVLA
ncbi:hydrolase [Vulcanimicrobium alpinum]|uniref:Hydrolase n=1 Tax=Vulcanimicrobium alpinum TaxID=3016050 RepID=A0AAN1XXE8_UNVUL|nr:Cof-type HAD-IIB family hydrolase [Vulcanimicrobium alpinum]BDE06700.1 hydrolase [Vulcanimicrobium alpinum]